MLVIFSDVHLTDGTSGTTINPRAFDKFGNILSDIIGEDPKEKQIEKIEVVLLGDIFDIIRSELWLRPENDNQTFPVRPWSRPEEVDSRGWNLEHYTRKIVQAIINDSGNIEAMDYLKKCREDWAAKDVEVAFTYLIGNHDWLLNRYGHTRFDIAKFIGMNFPEWFKENIFHEVFCFDEYQVQARHGDFYDNFNREGGRDSSSLGDAIVIDLLNRFPEAVRLELGLDKDDGLYQALKEVDNVRPLLQVPAWVQGVCNHFPKVEDKIHRVWNDTVDRFFALDFVRDHDRWGPDFMDFLEMALRLTSSFSFDKLREILGTWLAKGLYQNRNNYRHFAYEELPLQRNEARYVVYGHTHKAEQVPLDNVLLPGPPAEMRQKIYFNSGTWRKVFEQTVYDPDSCEFIGWHVMTFLVFYLAGEREPDRHFEMWSASLG